MRKKKNKPADTCLPDEFSLKSYFLAPNAENRKALKAGIDKILQQWFEWREQTNKNEGPFFAASEFKNKQFLDEQKKLLTQIQKYGEVFESEIPRHTPRYIGHMFSEYTLPAFFGHLLALMYNPNNISSESSLVGIKIEADAIKALVQMIGYPTTADGHFTSGGTIANFEMLYRAKMSLPEETKTLPWTLIVPESAHYSWEKGLRVFGGPNDFLTKISLNENGTMDTTALQEELSRLAKEQVNILAVVSVLGSTELGVFDPIHDIHLILKQFERKTGARLWHHVDAAYGGFFATLRRSKNSSLSIENQKTLTAMSLADSITLDPHKLGYVPYAAGCFLCRERDKYSNTALTAPYLDYKTQKDPGPFTLEGSRTVAGPLAVLLTEKTLGLNSKGLGVILEKTIQNTQQIVEALQTNSARYCVLDVERTNIVCFSDKGQAKTLSEMNKRTLGIYNKSKKLTQKKSHKSFYISKTTLSRGQKKLIEKHCLQHKVAIDDDKLLLIRCTIMNPFFGSRHVRVDMANRLSEWLNSL